MKRLCLILFTISLTGVDISAADAVNFLISIYQQSPGRGENLLVYSDSTAVVKGISASAFLSGFALDIDVREIDSAGVEFDVQIVTLGPQAQTVARRFRSEFDVPAFINDIKVKKSSFYSLKLVPAYKSEVDTRRCGFNHNSDKTFDVTPSANVDLYYLTSSLAHYHYLTIKSLFEAEYRIFRQRFHFKVTSKQNLYLFPCEGPSVIWDKRFGASYDPTRANAYVVYGPDVNSADPFVIIHNDVLRSYGYAPPFLSEGLSGYFSLTLHTMKKIVAAGKNLPLEKLVPSYAYLTVDPVTADATAATFVRYLIDQYHIERFMVLYEQSDDIDLVDQIESVYAKPLDVLENEWLNYVDTMKIPAGLYSDFALRAEQMFNYPQMLEYCLKSLELTETQADSVAKLDQLARAYLFNGDYYQAVGVQKRLIALDSTRARYRLSLATFQMMNGDFDDARNNLEQAYRLDSNDVIVRFNLAFNHLQTGDTTQAEKILNGLIVSDLNGQLQGESRVMLGNILIKSIKEEERQSAQKMYSLALTALAQQIQANQAVPSPYMWSGIALDGLGDPDNAWDQLQLALFLESRPFYLGMIYLWLGKTADLRHQREVAKDYYGRALSVEAAVYHQDEARRLLNEPYKQ